jgi:rfaE bifunctional protein nucleotidyltransferase chain/domain
MIKQKVILSLDSLYRVVRDVKSEGRRIGLTHGAFDLFHYSHLDLLRKSSAICDFLIVAVDSDKSVAKYKTYKRPIINEFHRTRIINELNCVDAVFIKDIEFNRQSHIELYKKLLVDVITIGIGFESRFKDLIEKEAEQAGAQLIEIKTYQNPTTTSIIDSIVDKYNKDDSMPIQKEEVVNLYH